MLNKLINDAFIIVVGKQSGEITEFMNSKKYVNEFIIAKKMNITVNQARNILYRLSDHGLVSSIRKKDKRKGWYTYFWKIESFKVLEFLKSVLIKKIEQINHQIKSRETKNFYVCERCNLEFNEENALICEFICPECGELFGMKDNSKVLNEFNKNVCKLKKNLAIVDSEIEKERAVLEKQKEKEMAKDKKEKDKKRAEKRKVAALKRAAKKKAEGKTVKKKTVKKKIPKKKKIAKKKLAKKKVAKKKVAKKNVAKKKSPRKKIVKKKSQKKKVKKK